MFGFMVPAAQYVNLQRRSRSKYIRRLFVANVDLLKSLLSDDIRSHATIFTIGFFVILFGVSVRNF